jgi:hypothetical protein
MLLLSEQRHEHMEQMLQFIRSTVGGGDLIFTDQATSLQLRHYLCNQKPASIEALSEGFRRFSCGGFRVVFTGPNEGALTAQSVDELLRNGDGRLDVTAGAINVWVVQGGWASGLGEDLRRMPSLSAIDVHTFGRYLQVFRFPNRPIHAAQG